MLEIIGECYAGLVDPYGIRFLPDFIFGCNGVSLGYVKVAYCAAWRVDSGSLGEYEFRSEGAFVGSLLYKKGHFRVAYRSVLRHHVSRECRRNYIAFGVERLFAYASGCDHSNRSNQKCMSDWFHCLQS